MKAALEGARDIQVEALTENAALLGRLRAFMQAEAVISATVIAGKEEAGAKFSDYFDHREKWADIPAHRALAIMRAANEEVVTVDIAPDPETGTAPGRGHRRRRHRHRRRAAGRRSGCARWPVGRGG